MTNVHLFRDVGRGVVDDNRLTSRLRNAQTFGGQRLLHLFSEKSRFEENIDKAGPAISTLLAMPLRSR